MPAEGGLVTEACERGQLGEKRNCGFAKQADMQACVPGEVTTLSCSVAPGAAPQAMRVCESSAVLGHGIPCLFREALASVTVTSTPVELEFTCPSPRDADEPGGTFATYTAPAVTSDAAAAVTCV